MSRKNRIRLWTDEPLEIGRQVPCTEAQRHYLVNVMRQRTGDSVYLFNGRDGEFEAFLVSADKKECLLSVRAQAYPYVQSPDVWLLFALIKKEQTDFVVSKAVELGVSRIVPVQTQWTNESGFRTERMKTRITEAAEQSRRQDIPALAEPIKLETLLENWPTERKLIFMDESGQSGKIRELMPLCPQPAAVLIGPEAGFSEKELEKLRNLPYTCGISLGKRILRAETAAISALACWQAFCGDWNK